MGLEHLLGGKTFERTSLQNLGLTFSNLHSNKAKKKLNEIYKVTQEILKKESLDKKVLVENIEKGVVVSLIGKSNFPPKSAVLTESTKQILSRISEVLIKFPYYVRIEGHSDRDNIQLLKEPDSKYTNNWELSAQRAINVLQYLQEVGNVNPQKMSIASYGKYRNITKGLTPEQKSFNRRVEIYIVKSHKYLRDYYDNQLPGNKIPVSEFIGR